MQYVLIIDRHKQPLMPCHPARARELLNNGKAAVYRRYPFTLIMTEREGGDTQPVEVKIDPGSRTSGIAVVVEGQRGRRVVWGGEILHRGLIIRNALDSRRETRHHRRARKTGYRPARFLNRRRTEEWLTPSLKSRVDNILTWVARLREFCVVTALAQEVVQFDTQALQNPEISGVEYQKGTLFGYEVRQYLLDKWERKCAYCGKTDVPLEIEHIIPRSRDGSDRVSNLTLACHGCNQRKGSQTAAEFGHLRLQAQAAKSFKDVAAVNSTNSALYKRLSATGLPVLCGTGGRTKFNRTMQSYPKAHWIDAACVGASGARVYVCWSHAPLIIKAAGRGSRQMCRMDKFGFPRTSAKAAKRVKGFQTGDMVRAIITSGTKIGTYLGRVAVRTSGKFNIATSSGMIQSVNHRYCTLVQHVDGYAYQTSKKGEQAFTSHSS